jgi:phosphonoacetaldehyde hydrolase
VSPGRPAPFLLFEAARRLGVYPMSAVVAADDTEAGVAAGRNAGCWSVGVAATGNGVGLSLPAWEELSDTDRRPLLEASRRSLLRAGADFVVDGAWALPRLLHEIDRLAAAGERPASRPGRVVTGSRTEVA